MSGGGSSNIGGTADVYTVKDMDISDDDFDVQIIGMSSPQATTACDVDIGTAGKMTPSKDSADASSDSSASKVIQCIRLPVSGQYVTCMLLTSDNQRVFIATASVAAADDRIIEAWKKHVGPLPGEISGCLFVFQVQTDGDQTRLSSTPTITRTLDGQEDAVKCATLLPSDFGQSDDSEVAAADCTARGLVATTTHRGNVVIYALADLSVIAIVSGDTYTEAIYCSGVDRLCAVTKNNRLKFFSVSRPDGLLLQAREKEMVDEIDGWLTSDGTAVSGSAVLAAGSETSSSSGTDANHHHSGRVV